MELNVDAQKLMKIFFQKMQMPGTIMAMARVNRPGIMIYGGTIKVIMYVHYLKNRQCLEQSPFVLLFGIFL